MLKTVFIYLFIYGLFNAAVSDGKVVVVHLVVKAYEGFEVYLHHSWPRQ
jgi:uncharacterized membrane protein